MSHFIFWLLRLLGLPRLPPPAPVPPRLPAVPLDRLGGQPLAGKPVLLSPQNIARAQPLAALGRGTLRGAVWADDGALIIDTAAGLYRHGPDDLARGSRIGPPLPQVLLGALPGGRLLLADPRPRFEQLAVWDSLAERQERTLAVPSTLAAAVAAGGSRIALEVEINLEGAGAPRVASRLLLLDENGLHLRLLGADDRVYLRPVWSPDGALLAVQWCLFPEQGPLEGQLDLLRAASGQLLHTLNGWRGLLRACAFLPGGAQLLTLDGFGGLMLWDVAGGTVLDSWQRPGALDLACSPDGALVVLLEPGGVALWETAGWQELERLPLDADAPRQVAFSPDGTKLLAVGAETLAVWDLRDRAAAPLTLGFPGAVRGLAFAPDGTALAAAYAAAYVPVLPRLWDLASGHERPFGWPAASLAYAPDGRLIATSSGATLLWDAASGEPSPLKAKIGPARHLAFSPGGGALAGIQEGPALWEVPSGRLLRRFAIARTLGDRLSGVNQQDGLAFSADGTLLAAGVHARIFVWETASGRLLRRLTHPSTMSGVLALAFAPDRRLLASVALDSLRLWDVARGRSVRLLRPDRPDRFFTSVAFSPDGRLLAAGTQLNTDGAQDASVWLWDAASGQQIAVLSGHTAPVSAVAFAPNGELLASAGMDGVVLLWGVL
ncbi:MAG: hypothetical protein OHK0022_25070 [Roseiflexaceae bacterium]